MGFYPVNLLLSVPAYVAFWLGRCLPCDTKSLMDVTGEADYQFVPLVLLVWTGVASSKLLMHWIPKQNPPLQPTF